MNKKLLTLVVAGAMTGMGGVANADVSVYGKAHVSYDYQQNDTSTAGAKDTYRYVSDNSSRVGFKVEEDLGGGLKSIAQWELAMRTDSNTAVSTNRNSYAGLSSGLGTIMLGKYDSPFKEVGRIADQFNERVGDARSVIGNGGFAAGSFDRRVSNMVRYQSPTFGGVVITGQYSSSDSATVAGGNQGSVSVVWSGAGTKVGASYDVQGTAGAESENALRLAGSFKMGNFTLGALVEALTSVAGTSGADRGSMGLSGAFALGKNVFKAQYFKTDALDTAVESGGSLMAIGYDYNFSKATTGYVAYAVASNDANTSNYRPSTNDGGHGETVPGVNLGGSPSALSVGLEMKF